MRYVLTALTVLIAAPVAHAAVFPVNNLNDAGAGSLRAAINAANVAAGQDSLMFMVSGIIRVTSAPLPPITDPLVVDGRTAPFYGGDPLVRIDNGTGNPNAIGLQVDAAAAQSEIAALAITRFGAGILLQGGGLNTVDGNWIGLTLSGVKRGNDHGVVVDNGSIKNVIGGTSPDSGNVISGNLHGVDIVGSGTTGNLVQGNFIGTDVTGSITVGNAFEGVAISGGATDNVVGGTTTGTSNVISGNGENGVQIVEAGTSGNFVEGNLVGTDAAGNARLPNEAEGVAIYLGATSNVVGGTDASARNVLSGNGLHGVGLFDAGTSDNLVQGNLVGTNAAGTAALPNFVGGVAIFNGATSNTIGGTDTGAGNVVSGNNGAGVSIIDPATSGNLVQGNLIGMTPDGVSALPNLTGVLVRGGAHDNTIGGATPKARNVVSGNMGDGVDITDAGTTGNLLQNDFVGTDASGTAALANANGVVVSNGAANNTVGGTTNAERNLISGNSFNGVLINGAGTSGNVVEGNYVGTAMSGTAALGNADGIAIDNGATGNTIGGGLTARNLISGNLDDGVQISGGGTSNNSVSGNFIGTDSTGTAALPNGTSGVHLSNGASDNTVGGIFASKRNLSGNVYAGVAMDYTGCAAARTHHASGLGTTGNLVAANYIGTEKTGTAALGNGSGVVIELGANSNFVGGASSGERNLISGNVNDGVSIRGCQTDANIVKGNFIGTEVTGTSALANGGNGVAVSDNASGNGVGGTTNGSRNVVSGNALDGIVLSTGAVGTVVQGNYVGTDAGGAVAVPNQSGIVIQLGASGNTIGGTLGSAGNVASGNVFAGIELTDNGGTPPGSTTGNVIEGNRVGTDVSGTSALPNGSFGVLFTDGPKNNTLGGTTAAAGNTIAFNGGPGVRVEAPSPGFTTNGDSILRNSIFDNAGLGISLLAGGNDLQPAPKITSVSTSGGTTTVKAKLGGSSPSTQFRIELFSNPSCDPFGKGEGKDYLAAKTIMTDASGSRRFAFKVTALPPGLAVTETATNLPSKDTSQFSNCGTTP